MEGSTPSSSPPPDMTVYIKEEPEDEGEDITVKDEPLCSEEYEVIFLTRLSSNKLLRNSNVDAN